MLKRITVFLQNLQDDFKAAARIVEEAELGSVKATLDMFGIEYSVDEVPAGVRLYDVTKSDSNSYLRTEIRTEKEVRDLNLDLEPEQLAALFGGELDLVDGIEVAEVGYELSVRNVPEDAWRGDRVASALVKAAV